MAESLVGRSAELELIGSFLDRAATAGGTLLLLGEPGVGKTALLDAAAAVASAAGTRVIRAQGVESEADMGFSGLHQALDPLAGEFNGLTDLHRDALSVVLGFGAGPPPDRLVVSTAALTLLRQVSAARPHLLIVDDVPWLDRPSADVLGFVARRLAGSPVGFLAAARLGDESRLGRGGLPEHEVAPLADEAASDLLRAGAPMLAPQVRRRTLAEAHGNPLALLELPTTLSGRQQAAKQALPSVLPLSRRLQALFESPMADLPGPTRQLLLLAALDGTGELSVLQAATGDRSLLELAPAERSRLVGVDASTRRLAFRHPLTRSAIVGLATSEERRGAHRVLAEALADEPERRARHLAEAAVEPDEQVAGLLEQVAHRIVRRGDGAGAVAALTRAAELSPGGSDRGRRLAEAAFVGANTNGDIGKIPDLLVAARNADPGHGGSLYAAAAAAVLLINGAGDIDAAHRLLVRAIEAHGGEYDAADEGLMAAIATLSLACSFDLARVRLAYGECLRRAHANAAARSHLGAALEAFHRLGAQPWATRAGNELRASGRTVAVPADHTGAATTLTAQEREIADLAATGLTNKQIGERLFLSHRTVSTHLYRIFPKLGITTRAALRDALAGLLASRLNGVAAAEVDRIAQ